MTSQYTTDPVPSAYRTEPRLPVIANPYGDEKPMPNGATANLFLLVAGFGLGALVILGAFMLLIGVGEIGQRSPTAATPAAQSAANAPVAPGPAPKPAPNTAGSAVPSTTGQAPAPADPKTPQAPTAQQQPSAPQK